MKRRKAVKLLATSVGALFALPAWAKGWSPATLKGRLGILNTTREALLRELVGAIIPEGVAPGAVALGVPVFVHKMLTDCFEKKAQDNFVQGLDEVEKKSQQTHNQPFITLTPDQKLGILKEISTSTDPALKDFYTQLKNLTIQGYTSSEYVLVNHWEYEMAPGHYNGCVPVKPI